MPYFKSFNLLYLHVPKTGGMSIEEYLYKKSGIDPHEKNIYGYYYDKANRVRVENERTLQHLTYCEIIQKKRWFDIEIGEGVNPDMKLLVSVRNPFDRILSEIFWNKRTGMKEDTTPEECFKIIHKYLYVDTHNFIDNHKTSQVRFIQDEKHLILKKNIAFVRTENLVKDMQAFGYSDFDIHMNKNETKVDYRKYLNADSIELIANYYAADFIHFGYSTDPTVYEYGDVRFFLTQPTQLSPILPKENPVFPTTFVTAFIRDVNKNRKMSDYIAFGEKLLLVSVPKVVFIDKSSYIEFFNGKTFPLTYFILFELEEMYYYGMRDKITDFNLETGNHEKDTMEYIFVQCYKTEWVRKAIDKNVYSSQQFIWVDFGVFHMIRDETVLKNGFNQMATKSYSRLRIATCKFREYVCPYDVYKRLTWNFAGSVFGGDANSLIEFADIVKKKIIETIEEKHTIMWELCVWYLVKDVVPDLYDCYICGHDFRILELY
jgi:hypothetical protein